MDRTQSAPVRAGIGSPAPSTHGLAWGAAVPISPAVPQAPVRVTIGSSAPSTHGLSWGTAVPISSSVPQVQPSRSPRPVRAVMMLAEQIEHSAPGVRKSAALALGRLGEAAARRGFEHAVFEHAFAIAEMQRDSSFAVREAAGSALAQVKMAAESTRDGRSGGLSIRLAQHLRQNASANFATEPTSEAELGLLASRMTRTASDGALFSSLSSSSLVKGMTGLRDVLEETCTARRWGRPRYQERVESDMKEINAILHRPSRNRLLVQERALKLAAELEHDDAGKRVTAALALGRLGAAGEPQLGPLRVRLGDRDSFVRAAVAVAMKQISGAVYAAAGAKRAGSPAKRKKDKKKRSPSQEKAGKRAEGTSGRIAKVAKKPNALLKERGKENSAPRSSSAGRKPPASSPALRPASASAAGRATPTQPRVQPTRPASAGAARRTVPR